MKNQTIEELAAYTAVKLKDLGLSDGTIVQKRDRHFKYIIAFFHEQGALEYNEAVLNSYIEMVESKIGNTWSFKYCSLRKNAALQIKEFHDTGTLALHFNQGEKLFNPSKELLSILEDAVASRSLKPDFQRKVLGCLRRFCCWLVKERGCKATTRNQRLLCIRSFYTYLATKNPCLMPNLSLINEIAKISIVKDEIPKFLSEKEMTLVLSLPDIHARHGLRDLTYLTLLYDSGARDNEIRSLRLQDILLSKDEGKIHLVGKGSKVRLTPISNCMIKLLKLYCDTCHQNCSNGNEFLFFTVHAGHRCKMSADNSARIMSKYELVARKTLPNIPHLHPHLFRHSRAMHLYQAGMPLVLVAEWLGHSQLETTLVYAHASTSMKRKAIEMATEGNDIIASNEKPKYMDKEKIIRRLYGLI